MLEKFVFLLGSEFVGKLVSINEKFPRKLVSNFMFNLAS
jgi:hypothetical protein